MIEYYEPTGYRRIPMTTCEGGLALDVSRSHPCPGKEDEYEEKRGLHGFALFCVIVLPITTAILVGRWIWIKTDGKFGQIRLGEENSQSPLVHYPILILSAIVAFGMTLPTIFRATGHAISSMFRRSKRFTTRSSFSRNGGYDHVHPEEGLLGMESDEGEEEL